MNAAEYLKSDHWRELKKLKRAQEPKQCLVCTTGKPVQLHHMIYRAHPHDSKLEDTCWLCKDCHRMFHRKIGSMLKGVKYENLREETIKVISLGETKAQKKARRKARKAHKRNTRMTAESWKVPKPKHKLPTAFSKPIPGVVVVNPNLPQP